MLTDKMEAENWDTWNVIMNLYVYILRLVVCETIGWVRGNAPRRFGKHPHFCFVGVTCDHSKGQLVLKEDTSY